MSEAGRTNVCDTCTRAFKNKVGLRLHQRKHETGESKYNDRKYIAKREANTNSVRLHRQNNPRIKLDDLEANTKDLYKEALAIEKYLKDTLGLNITSIDEKLKDYNNITEKLQ